MIIPIKKIFLTMLVITFVLLGIHTILVLYGNNLSEEVFDFSDSRFNINGEANIPAWYSTVILFSISVASFIINKLRVKVQKQPILIRNFWLITGMVFCFLSIDEMAQIHELIDQGSHHQFKWVYAYAPFVLIFFVLWTFYFRVIRNNDIILQYWFIGGLIVFVFGGVVLEFLEDQFTLAYALRHIERVAEEGLEMVGAAMILMGCLQEINTFTNKKIEKN